MGWINSKPLLVGEGNPHDLDLRMALYPRPAHLSGGRLCHNILGFKWAAHYLRAFDRVNLCPREWNMKDAINEANRQHSGSSYNKPHSQFILLGRKVAAAFRMDYVPPFTIWNYWGPNFPNHWMLTLPHPSSRTIDWYDPAKVKLARKLVRIVYPYDLIWPTVDGPMESW